MILCDESNLHRWISFFEDNLKPQIETIATKYPEERNIQIDYWVFDRANPELLHDFLAFPATNLHHAEKALSQIDTAIGKMDLRFSVVNIPDKLPIGKMRASHTGKFLSIDGLVKKRTEVRPLVTNAAFQCSKCGAIIRVEQRDDSLTEPAECYEDQGGCGRKSSWELNDALSTFIDSQRLEIQERLEDLKGGAQPEKLVVDVKEDLVGLVLPGDIIVINGIAVRHKRLKGVVVSTTFGKRIAANSIEIKEKSFEDIEVSPEDEKKILAASKDPMLYSNMMQSIAPSIYGMEVEKSALLLQLFGGVPKELPDGTRIRGDVHILLVGDPGIAKSQLLTYISKIAPRSIFCDGKGSSAAGLTAAAVRDDLGEGQWTLEAGALVLADGGIVCVDEIDKMDEHDRESLHSAMEQQVVRCDKAGIHATLRTRCALLAAANPKMGRFDRFMGIVEQINLPVSLMSRFDLIFALYDTSDKKHDEQLAAHIGGVHQKKVTMGNTAIYPPEFITKYVAYAKRCKPELSDESVAEVNTFYLRLRASASEGSIAITPRQLEALYRLSEASAKVRLADKVTVDDAKRAIGIFEEYLHRVGVDRETGQYDIDVIQSGISHSQHERMRGIIDLIRGLDDGTGAKIDELITTLETRGIDRKRAEEAIEKLKENRSIFEPGFGRLKVV